MITYCRKLFEHIKHEIGANDISLRFDDSDKIYFDHTYKVIVIGWQYLDDVSSNGFRDYRALQQIWTDNGYSFVMHGKQAVWATLIHEFSHYAQIDKNHSEDFKDKLDTMIKWFSFSEVKHV